MAVMKVLLVDSDRELGDLLNLHRIFRLEAELETTEQAAEYIMTHEVDAVFINHQPADVRKTSTGDFLSVLLSQSRPHVQVVVYSDSREWAYSAYRCQCAGYLLVPFDPLDLQVLVNRLAYTFDLQQAKRETANRSIMIKTKSGYQFTPLQDILFIVNLSKVSAVRADSGTKNYAIRFRDYEGEILLSREKYAELLALLKGRYAGINI